MASKLATDLQPTTAPPRVALERVDGLARVRFAKAGLAGLYQRAPCRLLFPKSVDNWPEAVSITTSGGLTGGDRVRVDIDVAEGARGTVTTQAAEKLYRVLPGDEDIRIETNIHVAAGGRAEWLAQEAILFDRTRFRRHIRADLEGDARLLAVESLVLGRGAMGETFNEGLVHDDWRIRRGGRLIWADTLHLSGDIVAQRGGAGPFGDATALATLLYVGPDADAHLDLARALLPAEGAGASCLDDMLIVRLLGADPAALKSSLMRVAAGLRAAALGRPETMPRVWSC